MMKFIKDLYLTIFALGYKSGIGGNWSRSNPRFGIIMDQGKGVFLVTIIAFFLLFGIKAYIEIHIGEKFSFDSSFCNVLVGLAIYYVNLYVLVTRGHGVKFEREFNQLKRNKKIILITSCSVLMLAVIALFEYVRDTYLHLPKN